MDYYWDRNGEPMSREDWMTKMSDDMYKRVALTTFPDGTFVSTVWLGLDHGFGSRKPVLWESMVFGPQVDSEQDYQWRYTSEERALAGHQAIVTTLQCGGGAAGLDGLEL